MRIAAHIAGHYSLDYCSFDTSLCAYWMEHIRQLFLFSWKVSLYVLLLELCNALLLFYSETVHITVDIWRGHYELNLGCAAPVVELAYCYNEVGRLVPKVRSIIFCRNAWRITQTFWTNVLTSSRFLLVSADDVSVYVLQKRLLYKVVEMYDTYIESINSISLTVVTLQVEEWNKMQEMT